MHHGVVLSGAQALILTSCTYDGLRYDLEPLAHRVCADGIVPYPPGIPVLVPGQLITPKITEYLASLLHSQKRTELHGIVHEGYQPCVRVLKAREEKSLRRIG